MHDFTGALERVTATIAAERNDPAIDPRCTPIVLHHGGPVDCTVVLFHGFTNCPMQFEPFARRLHERGANVYVPRLPRHGLRDKLTTDLAGLSADELRACARDAAEIGSALGGATRVLGLSVGATLAAWLAHTQALDRAIAIAPFFSVAHVPGVLEPALAGTLLLAPNAQMWWDPREKAALGPAHGYPRFATHALARCLELGAEVRDAARATAPRTPHATLVLNAKDPAIDNGAARDVWRAWRGHGAPVDEYLFEDLDARHDIIEPTTYPQAATLVYPVLSELLLR